MWLLGAQGGAQGALLFSLTADVAEGVEAEDQLEGGCPLLAGDCRRGCRWESSEAPDWEMSPLLRQENRRQAWPQGCRG